MAYIHYQSVSPLLSRYLYAPRSARKPIRFYLNRRCMQTHETATT